MSNRFDKGTGSESRFSQGINSSLDTGDEALPCDACPLQRAAIQERENARDARFDAKLEGMRAEMARNYAEFAKRDAAKAERDASARWWQTAVTLAGIGIAASVIMTYLPG